MGADVTTHTESARARDEKDLTPLSFPVPVVLLSNALSAVLRLSVSGPGHQHKSKSRPQAESLTHTHCGQGTLGPLATAWVAIQVVTLALSLNKNAFDVLAPWPTFKQIIEIERRLGYPTY